MDLGAARILIRVLFFGLVACAFGYAMCPVDVVIVKGRIEQPPDNATVRVQLVYPGNLGGDSGEATSVDVNFTVPVEFITQSRKPLLVGAFREKCDRKPETVIVTLVGGDPAHEYDRSSLELARDFKKTDSNTYALKSEIVLKGSR
jgi:hypothetical protein